MTGFFLSFCSHLPLKLNHYLGTFIGYLLFLFNTDAKKVTLQNIAICFSELSKEEQRSLVKKSLIETGKNLTESSLIWNQSFAENAEYIRNIHGEKHLDAAKNTILLVPHLGCWEITGRIIATNRAITFLFKPLKKQQQNQYLFERRNQGNLSMASADQSGVIKLQRALKQGELVGMLPDQDPGEEGGIMAPFFNNPVNTMTLLVRLAKKHNAQVVMCWANRLNKGKGFDLNFEPIDLTSDSDNLLDRVTLMNRAIENLIRRFPDQYMWSYPRFKSTQSYR
jgi:KDO2-lipid IV(A) lauroyltransferase